MSVEDKVKETVEVIKQWNDFCIAPDHRMANSADVNVKVLPSRSLHEDGLSADAIDRWLKQAKVGARVRLRLKDVVVV